MAEEAKDEGKTIPAAINRVQIAVFAIYCAAPVRRAERAAGDVRRVARRVRDAARPAGGPGRLRGRPDPRRRQADRPRVPAGTGRDLRRPARRDDPVPRDQRGDHRRLAARLLDGHPPPAARPIAPPAPEVRHALGRDHHLRRASCCILLPGRGRRSWATSTRSARCCRSRSRTSRSSGCGSTQPDHPRPYRAPFNVKIRGHDIPLFAVVRRRSARAAFVVVTVLHLAVAIGGVVWLVLGIGVYVVYRRRQGLDLTTTTKVAVPRPSSSTRRSTSRCSSRSTSGTSTARRVATAARLAARRRRGIYILVTITVPNSSPIDAQLPEPGDGGAGDHRAGPGALRAARERPLDEGARRPGGPRHRRGGASRSARGRSSLPLPPRTGHHVFGKTVETVLAERPAASSSRPVPPTATASAVRSPVVPDPRDVHRAATRILSAIMVVIGVLLLVADVRRRWRAGLAGDDPRRAVPARRDHAAAPRAEPALDGLPAPPRAAAAARRVPARAGRAAPLLDHLHVGRERDLLLARGRRRPRARADAGRLPRRRAVLRRSRR